MTRLYAQCKVLARLRTTVLYLGTVHSEKKSARNRICVRLLDKLSGGLGKMPEPCEKVTRRYNLQAKGMLGHDAVQWSVAEAFPDLIWKVEG